MSPLPLPLLRRTRLLPPLLLLRLLRLRSLMISNSRAEALEKKKEIMKEAQEELEKWREERAKKLAAKAEMNRQEEEKLIEGNKEDMQCANPWERVNKLVDINEEKEHDMSRMKQVMIRMKGDAAKM